MKSSDLAPATTASATSLPVTHFSPLAFLLLLVASIAAPDATRAGDRTGYRFEGAGWLSFPDLQEEVAGIDVGDLDGDGVPDVVVSVPSTPPSLRSYLADSPLCFSPAFELEVSMSGTVFLGDATGNGRPEVIVVSQRQRQVGVFRAAGDGGLAELASLRFDNIDIPAQIHIHDIDGDGERDIVVVGSPTFIAWGPTFSTRSTLAENSTLRSLLVLQADADGSEDLLATTDGSDVLLFLRTRPRQFEQNGVAGRARGPLSEIGEGAKGSREVFALTLEGFSSFVLVEDAGQWEFRETVLETNDPRPRHYLLGDLDDDGHDDLVVWREDDILEVRFADASGLPVGGSGAVTALLNPPGYFPLVQSRQLRDVNGDGLLDVLTGNAYLLGRRNHGVFGSEYLGDLLRLEKVALADHGAGSPDQLIRASRDDLRVLRRGADGLEEIRYEISTSNIASISVGRPDPGGPLILLERFGGDRFMGREIGPEGNLGDAVPIAGIPESVAAAQFTRWGDLDRLAILRRAGNSRRTTLSFLDQVDAWSFEEGGRFDVLSRAVDVAVHHLDGDGYPDVVVRGAFAAGVVRGGPSGFESYRAVAAPPWDRSDLLTCGDLDGDGASEILAARLGSDEELLLLRSSAEGAWSSHTISTSEIQAVDTADLNGDGWTDVIADIRYGLEIFYNDGEGDLVMPPTVAPGSGSYATESELEVLDMDGDGHSDVVFNRTITFGTGTGPGGGIELVAIGEYRPTIRTGDLNGDGNVDFVVFYQFHPAEVFLGLGGSAFGDALPLPGPDTRAYDLEIADLDGDGTLDLIANIVTTDLQWFRGRGDGSFEDPVSIPGGQIVLAADVNADGPADLIVFTQGAGVFIRSGGGSFALTEPVQLSVELSRAPAAGLVDLDGDGAQDLFLSGELDNQPHQVALPVSSEGVFGEPIVIDAPSLLYPATLFTDLDGDGLHDSVRMIGNSLFLVRSNGDFTFEVTPIQDFDEDFVPMKFFDVNGDGVVDILGNDSLLGNCIVAGKEDGSYEEPAFFSAMTHHFVIDVNADGLMDALATRYVGSGTGAIHAIPASREHLLEGSRFYRFLLGRLATGEFDGADGTELVVHANREPNILIIAGAGQRHLRIASELPLPEGTDSLSTDCVAAGDYDGDGRDDVVLLKDGTVYGYRALGDLTFGAPAVLVSGVPGTGVLLADLDLDGHLDIFVAGFSVARGLGDGSFEPAREYFGESSVLGDVDGDGLLDVVHTLDAGPVFVSNGIGDARFRGMESLIRDRGEIASAVVGDFNGDGLGDVAVALLSDRDVEEGTRVFYGQPESFLSAPTFLDDPLRVNDGARALATRDLDGDGFDDLLHADAGGYLVTYFGSESGLGAPGAITDVPPEASYVVAGDFVGGPEPDLISGGATGVFLTRGGTQLPTPIDCDDDGVPDAEQLASDPSLDCDGNDALDVCDIAAGLAEDCDVDGVIDSCVIGEPGRDCDANGLLDTCQIAADPSSDCDASGALDTCEIVAGLAEDCDADGVIDSCVIGEPGRDCDEDGSLDTCQIAADASSDCDASGSLDSCEIDRGELLDGNGNGIADVCEGELFHRGDANASGKIDLSDATRIFAHRFMGGEEPPCAAAADANADHEVDIADGIYIVMYLFLDGKAPPYPGPTSEPCGVADAEDTLGCESYAACNEISP